MLCFHVVSLSVCPSCPFLPPEENFTNIWPAVCTCSRGCHSQLVDWSWTISKLLHLRMEAKHTVLYSAHLKRKLLCLILKHSWSCCSKCCFPWFYFFMLSKSELTSAPKCLMFNLVALNSNPSLHYKMYSVFSIPRHYRDVPVCDFVQLHSGRRVHRTGHAPSECWRGLRGRQGVHNQGRHRCLPLRAEQCKRTHNVTYTAL